jgi:hypothetical protein
VVKRRWTRKKNAKAYRRAVIPFALGRTTFNWTERASGGTAASGSGRGSGSASAVRTSHFAQRLPAATPKERLLHLVDVLCAPGCIRSRWHIIQTVRLGPPQKSSVRLVTGFRNEAPAATLPLAVSTAEVTVRIPRGRLPHLAEHTTSVKLAQIRPRRTYRSRLRHQRHLQPKRGVAPTQRSLVGVGGSLSCPFYQARSGNARLAPVLLPKTKVWQEGGACGSKASENAAKPLTSTTAGRD